MCQADCYGQERGWRVCFGVAVIWNKARQSPFLSPPLHRVICVWTCLFACLFAEHFAATLAQAASNSILECRCPPCVNGRLLLYSSSLAHISPPLPTRPNTHTRLPYHQDFRFLPYPNMQSVQDMANLAKVSTEHLIEEIQRRLHCAGKQEKKTIFIGTQCARG